MKKIYVMLIAVMLMATSSFAQVTVTGDGAGGSPYATLELAINAVNAVGTLTQPTVITTSISETAPAGGYSITAIGSAANTLVINGSGNIYLASTAHTVGAINDAVFKLIGADYVTIQGFTLQENPANTTTVIATNNMTEWGIALLYGSLTNGAQNNTIQTNNISLNRTYLNTFGIYSNTRHSATSVTATAEITAASGSNSFNKVYSNTIGNVNHGIVFIGAGTTIAAIDNGNDIGGTSAATGNTLTNWGGGPATSGYVSLPTTANYGIYLNQQINDNISYNLVTSATGLTTTTNQHNGIIKAYTVASPTTGTATTTNMNNNTVNILNSPTTGQMTGMGAQGMAANASATINMNNNLISGTLGAGATSAAFVGVLNSSGPGVMNFTNNTIRNVTTSATTGPFIGFQQQTNAVQTTLNITNNKIGDAIAGAVTFGVANSGASAGLVVTTTGAAATTAVSITGNDIRGITYSALSTGSNLYISQSSVVASNTISNNTFTNLNVNTSGTTTFIAQTYSATATGTKTVSGNSIVTGFNRGGASGAVLLITDNGSSVTGSTSTVTNNNFSNITIAGTSTIVGINLTDGGTAPAKTVTGNILNNWTGGTGSMTGVNITYLNGISNISNNTVTNISGQGSITGMTFGATVNTATSVTISGNTINTLASSGAGGAVTGIACSNTSTGINISNHSIHTLSSTGAATVSGITISGSNAAGTNVFKNNIYNLSNTNANPTVSGITISGGTLTNAYNNFVSDVRAPNANAAVPIYGINVSGGTNAGIYYNTIALGNNATLTSAGAQFGVTGIGYGSTVNTTLRNNIVWIDATPVGTGAIAAVRRSAAGVANTAPTATNFNSNNNIYNVILAAGSPPVAANINKYLYLEGNVTTTATNGYGIDIGQADVIAQNLKSDINFNTACGIYKTFMGAREGGTFNENNLTASGAPNFTFVPSGASFASNSGLVIATPSITDDYNSVGRTATPDMGALEFTGTSIDATPPSIAYTSLTNTICTSGPSLNATINDASGVNVTPGLAPRLYYRKGGATAEADAFGTYPGDNTSAFNGWKYVEATGTAPNFSFAINYSLLQSAMAVGDSLTYFVMAQDNNGVTNVGKNVVTFSGSFCPTSVDLSGVTNTTSGTNGYRIIGIPTFQPATTAVTAGSINQQVLRIDIPANQCGTLTQLDFTNLSTASADISRARVYYTTTTTFATTTQFGVDVISPAGSYVVTGTQALSTTLPNYFWLVYDISCAAPTVAGNTADADVTAVTVGSVITVPVPNQNPTGTRTINTLASAFLGNQPSTASVQQGAISQQVYRLDIPATSCGNITNIDFLNASGTPADVTAARVYYTTTPTFSTAIQFGTDFVNPGATFSITGSVTPSATLTNYFWLVYDINCAATVANLIDGGATSITIGGTPQAIAAPLIQNPAGTRSVVAAVVGDNITSAPIAVIGAAATNAYTIVGKSLEAGEPSPILNTNGGGAAGTSNYSWGTAAGATAWYKLDVPLTGEGSSGNLLITASTVGGSSSTDCQVALWEFPSMTTGCGVAPNYTGARLLQANDDAFTGFAASGGTLNSTIRCRVTPGNTYYIQVDGFNTATPNGNVYVEDLSFAPYTTANNGLGSYHNPTGVDMQFAAYEVNGTDGWTYYYNNNATVIGGATVPNIADDRVLIAKNWSANPNFTYRGTYLPGTEMVNHVKRSANSLVAPSTTAVLSATDSIIVWTGRNNAAGASVDLKPTAPYVAPSTPAWHMMNKFWNTVPKVQPTSAVGVRVFYSDADYTALNLAAGGIMAMHSDMKFLKFTKSLTTHYTNAEVDPALGQAAITAGTASYLTWTNTDGVEAGADPINQAQFDVTSFSGGGGGAALNNPLPIVVNYLRGAKQGAVHNLNWKVTCTSSPTATMILERSGDNRTFTAINNITADALRCAQPFDYVDASPLVGINYYRLKIIDANGKVTYSNTIAMANIKTGVTIVGIVPNPVTSNGNATLNVASAQKGLLRLVITDVTGRQIAVQSEAIIAGSNQLPINVAKLAAGIYNITAITDDGNKTTVRFVKQ